MEKVRLDGAIDTGPGCTVVGRRARMGDVPHGVGHAEVAETIVMSRADGQCVERVARRQDASQEGRTVDGPDGS